jgi:hypothetical protein
VVNTHSVSEKIVLLVEGCWDRNIKKSDHHLLVRLISPADRGSRIRIVRIVAGIAVPRDTLQFGPGFKDTCFCERRNSSASDDDNSKGKLRFYLRRTPYISYNVKFVH